MKYNWPRLRLPNVRLHDLRHSFASVGAASGDSLLIIGKLLCHKNAASTQRYAHLGDDALREMNDKADCVALAKAAVTSAS